MIENLVVGSGFSGAVIANFVATELNEKVLVIDRKHHIAGSAFDYPDKNEIMIHKYGSHIFHTSHEKVWNFVCKFGKFNQYMHKVIAVIDGIEAPVPFNFNSIYRVFPPVLAERISKKLLAKFAYGTKIPILEFREQTDKDLRFLAEFIYEKVFLHYTAKQWGVAPEKVHNSVTARVPVYLSCDNRYFQDKYQGIPLVGYTQLIRNMLDHPNITVKLNCDFKQLDNTEKDCKRIFYTGSIDEFFDYDAGKLSYRSLRFEFEEHNQEFYQSNAVVNYPENYDFTRIHEFKYYLNNVSEKTVIAKEYPEIFSIGVNERYYPVNDIENMKLYALYRERSQELKNVYFLGRLGNFCYYDMDDAILNALELGERIKNA